MADETRAPAAPGHQDSRSRVEDHRIAARKALDESIAKARLAREQRRIADRAIVRVDQPRPCPIERRPRISADRGYCNAQLVAVPDIVLIRERDIAISDSRSLQQKTEILGKALAGPLPHLKRTLAPVLPPPLQDLQCPVGRAIITDDNIEPGHGLRIGYYAQEHEHIDVKRSVLENMVSSSPNLTETEARRVLGSFLFTGDDAVKPAGVLSGGEKTRLALAMIVVSGANVLLLDEPTNNLDPASREEILGALASYTGAVVLVSHDEGAVEALNPERVLILPDGVEDHWNKDYADLISLA